MKAPTMPLGLLGEFKNGLNFSNQQMGHGTSLINVKDITSSHRMYASQFDLVGIPFDEGYLARQGDLFFVRSSVKLDGIGLVSKVCDLDEQQIVHCGFVIRFRPTSPKVESDYLLYLLRSPLYRERIKGLSGGAAIVNVSQAVLKGLHVPLPSIDTQHRIAGILSAYDDLIENNRRRIQLLEQAGRLIYQEWFVRLRFPGHERVRVVDGVLEGWEKRKLGDILILNYGKGLKESERIEGDVPVYGSSGVVGYHDQHLVEGPGIIIGRKGNVGSVFWSQSAFFPIDTVYYVDSQTSSLYLFHLLQNLSFQSSDGAVPGLNRNYAYSLPVRVPPPGLVAHFEGIAGPIYQQILNLQRQNERLRQARDLLLPKLMSGEIAV